MIERRGKVIVYKCDICKEEITAKRLVLRLMEACQGSGAVWDLCAMCTPKLTEMLGKGRATEPFPRR